MVGKVGLTAAKAAPMEKVVRNIHQIIINKLLYKHLCIVMGRISRFWSFAPAFV
jgi:ATP-dependent helicase/DNAse subunit B